MGVFTRRFAANTVACIALMTAILFSGHAASAQVLSSCGSYDPICPYQSTQVFGASDPGSLSQPYGLAQTPDGNVVLADREKGNVREFSSTGTFIRQIGIPADYYQGPDDIAVDQSSGEIWVSDKCDLHGFTAAGVANVYVDTCTGNAATDLNPAAIAVGPAGDLYVFDSAGLKIFEYSPTGAELGSFSVSVALNNALDISTSADTTIAVDGSGNVYIAPQAGDITEFSSSGMELASLPKLLETTGIAVYDGDLYEASSGEIEAWNLSSQDPGAFMTATGSWTGDFESESGVPSRIFSVGVDGLEVATANNSIEQFDLSGNELGSWGGLATDDFDAVGLAADSAGDLYVVDEANHRIIRYPAGGGAPNVLASYSTPPALVTNPQGNVVIDDGNGLQTYNSAGQVIDTQTPPCDCGLVGYDAAGDLYLSGSPLSSADGSSIREYSSSGTLLHEWDISGGAVVAPNGDIWADGFWGSDSSLYGKVAEFSDTGQLLQTVDQGPWEMTLSPALAVDPTTGRVYLEGAGAVEMLDPSGSLIAVWPYSDGDNDSADPPGGGFAADNGVVYVGGPGYQITTFSNFLNPLPAVPSGAESPFSEAMSASLSSFAGIGQISAGQQAVSAPIDCSGTARCSGSAVLTTRNTAGRRLAKRATVIGRTTFTVKADKTTALKLKLNAKALKPLRHRSTIQTTLTVTYSAGTTHRTIARKLTLHRRPA